MEFLYVGLSTGLSVCLSVRGKNVKALNIPNAVVVLGEKTFKLSFRESKRHLPLAPYMTQKA